MLDVLAYDVLVLDVNHTLIGASGQLVLDVCYGVEGGAYNRVV